MKEVAARLVEEDEFFTQKIDLRAFPRQVDLGAKPGKNGRIAGFAMLLGS